jgi:hypothetical protein
MKGEAFGAKASKRAQEAHVILHWIEARKQPKNGAITRQSKPLDEPSSSCGIGQVTIGVDPVRNDKPFAGGVAKLSMLIRAH